MPIFVGSNSDDSRIRSNRVGFSVSTANPGTASEGDVYFNSSDSGLRAYDGSAWSAVGAGGGSFSGIASGTLANGQTVIITTDGKISGITTIGLGLTSGETNWWGSNEISGNTVVYDESRQKLFVVYHNVGNSDRPYGVVGTITGTGITFGTPQQIVNSAIYLKPAAVYHPPSKKIIIGFHYISGVYAYAVTIKDDNTFEVGQGGYILNTSGIDFIRLFYHKQTENVVAIFKARPSTNDGIWGRVLEIQGDVVSAGGAAQRASTAGNILRDTGVSAAYIESDGRVIATWWDQTDGYKHYQAIGTISGTSLTWGTQQAGPGSYQYLYLIQDPPSGNILATMAANDIIKYKVGIVTEGDSFIQYNSIQTPSTNQPSSSPTYLQPTYDPIEKKYLFIYRQENPDYSVDITQASFNGTTLTLESTINSQYGSSYNPAFISNTYASDKKINVTVVGILTAATAFVVQSARTTSNLTSDNFLGFSDASYTNGQTAAIQIAGAIDDAQSGLTTGSLHYVQSDGTLSTTAGTPSVFAGTALSATKIKVKK